MALFSEIYNEQFHTEIMEQLIQNLNVLNGASNNTIVMGSESFMGHYLQESFFGDIADLVERRDITVDTGTTDKRMSTKENVEVVIDFKTRLFETYENMLRTGRTMDVMTTLGARRFAERFIKRHVNLSVGAAVAAAVTSVDMFDASLNASTTDYLHLLKAQELFEDNYDDVAAYVMNTNAWFDLRRDTLSTYTGLDTVAGMQIITGATETLGKPIIISNIPALSWDSDGLGNIKNRIVALRPGAIRLTERAGRVERVQEVTDQENLGVRWATDGSVRVGLMGYAWDIASGGPSPTDAALQTGTNWDAIVDNANSGIAVVDSEQA